VTEHKIAELLNAIALKATSQALRIPGSNYKAETIRPWRKSMFIFDLFFPSDGQILEMD